MSDNVAHNATNNVASLLDPLVRRAAEGINWKTYSDGVTAAPDEGDLTPEEHSILNELLAYDELSKKNDPNNATQLISRPEFGHHQGRYVAGGKLTDAINEYRANKFAAKTAEKTTAFLEYWKKEAVARRAISPEAWVVKNVEWKKGEDGRYYVIAKDLRTDPFNMLLAAEVADKTLFDKTPTKFVIGENTRFNLDEPFIAGEKLGKMIAEHKANKELPSAQATAGNVVHHDFRSKNPNAGSVHNLG